MYKKWSKNSTRYQLSKAPYQEYSAVIEIEHVQRRAWLTPKSPYKGLPHFSVYLNNAVYFKVV